MLTLRCTLSGITTSLLNLSLTLFPILVAHLISLDPTYYFTEMFFTTCSIAGVAVAVVLFFVDSRGFGGVLEKPEKEAGGEDGNVGSGGEYVGIRSTEGSLEDFELEERLRESERWERLTNVPLTVMDLEK